MLEKTYKNFKREDITEIVYCEGINDLSEMTERRPA
jgi:hypothetical protein